MISIDLKPPMGSMISASNPISVGSTQRSSVTKRAGFTGTKPVLIISCSFDACPVCALRSWALTNRPRLSGLLTRTHHGIPRFSSSCTAIALIRRVCLRFSQACRGVHDRNRNLPPHLLIVVACSRAEDFEESPHHAGSSSLTKVELESPRGVRINAQNQYFVAPPLWLSD